MGTETSFPSDFSFILYYFSWRYPLKGARPVPAPIIITFFHCPSGVKVDLRSSAFMACGFIRKKEEMRPLGVRLAATTGLGCVWAWEARVKSLGAIESDSSRKS